MSSYTVVWIITILGIALLGQATSRAGQGVDSRRALAKLAWFVVFLGMAFLGGIVGGVIASVL